MRPTDHFVLCTRFVRGGGWAATLALAVAGCSGPWFGPGGFDRTAIERSAAPADVAAFHAADADDNGVIDRGEARARLGGRADVLDIDGDDQISATEFLHHRAP